MERAMQTALKKRQCILNRVGVNFADAVGNIVVNALVPTVKLVAQRVDLYRVSVRVDSADSFRDVLL